MRHLLLVLACLFALPAQAAEVSLPYGNLTLTGQLRLAAGKSIAQGAVVIVHDELQDAASVGPAAAALVDKGQSVLAVTLSLGQDSRHGKLPCDAVQTHKHSDAADEIKIWLEWLKKEGAEEAALMGFGRGANQVAGYLTGTRDLLVSHVILVDPMTWAPGRTAAEYQARFNDDLGRRFRDARGKAKAGEGKSVLDSVGFLDCPKAKVTAEAFADYYAPDGNFDTPTLVKRLKQPTLVVASPAAPADLPHKMREVQGEHLLFEQMPIPALADRIVTFLAR